MAYGKVKKRIAAAAAAVLVTLCAAGCRGEGTKPEKTPLYAMIRMPDGQMIEGPVNMYVFSYDTVLIELSDGSRYKTSAVNCCLYRNAPGTE